MAIIILLRKEGDKATEFYESSTFTQLAQQAAHCAQLRVLLLISALPFSCMDTTPDSAGI